MSGLVALAKAQPGQAQLRIHRPGSLPHLAGELLKLMTGIDIVHVPYRGAAPAITDLLSQQVQMTFLHLPAILPHIKSGAPKPIALGTTARAPTAPMCRPPSNLRMPELMIENWYGMIAPAGTPPAIVATLNKVTLARAHRHERQGKARRAGPDHRRRQSGAFSCLDRPAKGEMGQGDQRRRHPDDEVSWAAIGRLHPLPQGEGSSARPSANARPVAAPVSTAP